MATITISRTAGFVDAARAYSVVLDGHVVGKLSPGASATYDVKPGIHRLRIKIDWCSSKELTFSVAAEGNTDFEVRSALRGLKALLALWYVFFERDGYLELQRSS